MLLISAPVPVGSIPSGLADGLIVGHERISLSSTIANAHGALHWFELSELVRPSDLAARRLVPRHLQERLVAFALEREQHDRLVRRRVEVLADAGELQLLAGHVRVLAVGRVAIAGIAAVLEEVVVDLVPGGTPLASPGQTDVVAFEHVMTTVFAGTFRTFQPVGILPPCASSSPGLPVVGSRCSVAGRAARSARRRRPSSSSSSSSSRCRSSN